MKHLKGPYGLSATMSSDFRNIRYINADLGEGKPYKAIATVHFLKEVTQEENLAVAKLLSLAPELRDALQAFVDHFEWLFAEAPEGSDAYHTAKALLAQLPQMSGDEAKEG